MDTICEGAAGAAVEDIQERLESVGYGIDEAERAERRYGRSTATAVARFRLDHGLSLGDVVDTATWSALVDECYQLGDRTLYLRLPNFHGNDVRQLQERLNILGFSCGEPDGTYGVHTEAAVKLFQESIGVLADGMAFPDTFDAIERLRHVWAGKPAAGPHPMGGMGFARAASVLENAGIAITANDPISRNVHRGASRERRLRRGQHHARRHRHAPAPHALGHPELGDHTAHGARRASRWPGRLHDERRSDVCRAPA